MSNTTGPRGWRPGNIETRFARTSPGSYDSKKRTVEAVLATDTPVKRPYGSEVLQIDSNSVNLERLLKGGIPVLDSHNQWGINAALGRVESAWCEAGELVGLIAFHDTDAGRDAEGMVARGELTGVSAGYRVNEWNVTDEDGAPVDPSRLRYDDDGSGLTYTATSWELLEASLVTIPADAGAGVRHLTVDGDRRPGARSQPFSAARALARMIRRHSAFERDPVVMAEACRQASDRFNDEDDHDRADQYQNMARAFDTMRRPIGGSAEELSRIEDFDDDE